MGSYEDGCQEVKQGETREVAAEFGSMKIISSLDKWSEKGESAIPLFYFIKL